MMKKRDKMKIWGALVVVGLTASYALAQSVSDDEIFKILDKAA